MHQVSVAVGAEFGKQKESILSRTIDARGQSKVHPSNGTFADFQRDLIIIVSEKEGERATESQ